MKTDLAKTEKVKNTLMLFESNAYELDDNITALSALAVDEFREDLINLRSALNAVLEKLSSDIQCFKMTK